MRHSLPLLAGFPVPILACEREFRGDHFQFEFSGHIQNIEARAERFPPEWTKEEEILHTSFSATELETWASYYTHGDHIAGRNKSMADETARKWSENGVPSSVVEYEVFLNYPESQSLVLNLPNGTRHEAQMFEDVVEEDETTKDPKSVPAFLGYSASGEVEAEYVYVGRGHKDDFNALRAANVTLEGKIAIAKYGGPFRGVKVKNAEQNGMVGVVLYTDPGDDGPKEAQGSKPYPDGPARHPSSIQRGSVAYIDKYIGDPTTPGYASKPGVERVTPSNLPKIPAVAISHRDAQPILKALDGHGSMLTGRSDWVGGLKANYSSGPAPGITLSLSNKMQEVTTPIWNVIGMINGTNANETVIIGNHRDAWIVGGAADPNSGSAILIEMTKAFGKLLETGWKPRRNIVFASWDAEEYGIVGSTEWVEEHAPWLSETAIAYINVDIGVTGNYPGGGATPEFRNVAQDVMKKVVHGNRTLYDSWYQLYRFLPEDNGFLYLGAASDYAAFLQLGIGAVDFGMDRGPNDPVYHYHSNYDSHHWMRTLIDPDYSTHATCGQFLTLLVHRVATEPLIPYSVYDFGRNINYLYRDINPARKDTSREVAQSLNEVLKAFQRLYQVTMRWDEKRGEIERNATRVEEANKMFKKLQRLFVAPEGIPGREFWRHLLYAPNRDDGYKAVGFPGSREAIEDGNWENALKWNSWAVKAMDASLELLNSV